MTLGYVCKYTPAELLAAAGADPVRLAPAVAGFEKADAGMHPNICSYAKSVLEAFDPAHCEGIVFTTFCDSIRRLYDVMRAEYPDYFFYLLDIPRIINPFTEKMTAERMLELAKAYTRWRKQAWDPEAVSGRFEEILRRRIEAGKSALRKHHPVPGALRIGVAGARCPENILDLLQSRNAEIAFNLTCTGTDRDVCLSEHLGDTAGESGAFPADSMDPSKASPAGSPDPSGAISPVRSDSSGVSAQVSKAPDPLSTEREDSLLRRYVAALLGQIPCMRMAVTRGREDYIRGMSGNLDGIVYHTVKFCDMYSYEYTDLKRESSLPILHVETDLTGQSAGQVLTRVEAFLESLNAARQKKTAGRIAAAQNAAGQMASGTAAAGQASSAGRRNTEMEKPNCYVLGVDSGSTTTNAVLMNGQREILAAKVIRTGAKTADSADRILREILTEAGLSRDQLSRVVSTGYGRISIPYTDRSVTEISCHAKGALYFDPAVRSILDIGGQDSKAIRIGEDGSVADFVMNDKCAAGTGRFLEAMARTLETDVGSLAEIAKKATEKVEISSMCTVFAESEVISLIAQNKEKADIADGVHRAIAKKAVSLLRRIGIRPKVCMTGGVALNSGVVQAVEELIGQKVTVFSDPEIVGAAGAALYALEDIL